MHVGLIGGISKAKKIAKDALARLLSKIIPWIPGSLLDQLFHWQHFQLWENKGFHVMAVHWNEPIPDTRTLKENLWVRRYDLVGLNINDEAQLELLNQFASQFKAEYRELPSQKTPVPYQFYIRNGTFESVDAEVLYCMIRYFKPKRIIEIGSGNSTYLAAQAIRENNRQSNNHPCNLIAIEPYPNKVLREGFPGLTQLMRSQIQDVPLSIFGELEENDILFIDSSHILKIGNDVQYEYLEILPILRKGVIIHSHDIFLPSEYPKEWTCRYHMFYSEQYLLQAFLLFNEIFETLWAASYMHLAHSDELEDAFSSYNRKKDWPCSFWIRRNK